MCPSSLNNRKKKNKKVLVIGSFLAHLLLIYLLAAGYSWQVIILLVPGFWI